MRPDSQSLSTKKFRSLSGAFGFAAADNDYSVYANNRFFHAAASPFYGDNYGQGNRPFMHAAYKIAPGVSAFGFYTREVGSTRVLTYNQQAEMRA